MTRQWLRRGAVAVACVVVVARPSVSRADDAAKAAGPDPSKGPGAGSTPPARWGAVVYDPVNGEHVWFGGSGGPSREGALGTWVLRDGRWRELAFKPSPEYTAAKELEHKARDLYAAVANRYYRSETADEAKADLAAAYTALADSAAPGPGQESAKALAAKLAGDVTVKDVAAARAVWTAMVKRTWACATSPPVRSKPAMAFDAKTGKIVLFGGEGVHGVYNDTWVYDCRWRTWSNPQPARTPTPRLRAGIIARDGRVYLIGGYRPRGHMGYQAPLWERLPFDLWRYDIAANTWTRLAAGEDHPYATNWTVPIEVSFSEDVSEIRWQSDNLKWGRKQSDVSGVVPVKEAGEAEAGVAPGAILVRGFGFNPAWYEDVPPADPAAVEVRLKALSANKWVAMSPPRGHVQRDWGTTVLDARRGQLLHWGGGHCTHFGTDVAHYSIATNRWHKLHTPELPFEHCYNSGSPPAPALTVRPWAPHVYLGYAMDTVSGLMLWAGLQRGYEQVCPEGTWLYDPATYRWRPGEFRTLAGRLYPITIKTSMAPTPRGVAVWGAKQPGYGGPSGLWLADVADREYRPVAGTDADDTTTYPPAAGDPSGIVYDPKRRRVLMFHFGVKDKHQVWATDLASGKLTVLTPKHAEAFPRDANFAREATYIDDTDLVIICSRGKPTQHTLVYDCAENAWLQMAGTFDTDARGRPSPLYGVSSGIEWDAKRGLLWHVAARGQVHVMRFDRATANLKPVGPGAGR